MIYVLKLDDGADLKNFNQNEQMKAKIGNSADLKQYQIKANQEKYLIDLEFIKETIKYYTAKKLYCLKK